MVRASSAGIEKFLPYSFDLVNKTARVFHKQERRFVYTTPKSYLELLKLYKDLLARKRDEMGRSIDRLTNGLAKLRSTAEAVVEIEADLKIKLEDAEQKKTTAEGIATEVRVCGLGCGGGCACGCAAPFATALCAPACPRPFRSPTPPPALPRAPGVCQQGHCGGGDGQGHSGGQPVRGDPA